MLLAPLVYRTRSITASVVLWSSDSLPICSVHGTATVVPWAQDAAHDGPKLLIGDSSVDELLLLLLLLLLDSDITKADGHRSMSETVTTAKRKRRAAENKEPSAGRRRQRRGQRGCLVRCWLRRNLPMPRLFLLAHFPAAACDPGISCFLLVSGIVVVRVLLCPRPDVGTDRSTTTLSRLPRYDLR